MIKSLVCAGCICVLLLHVPKLAGQDVVDNTGPIDIESQILKPISGSDSFGRLTLQLFIKNAENGSLEISDGQRQEIYVLGQKIPKWQVEEEKKLERIHGKRINRDMEFAGESRPMVIKAIEERLASELKNTILVPFQISKLNEYCATELKNNFGDFGYLTMPWVRNELDIDDEQLERLEARVKKEQEKLEGEIKKLEEQIAELQVKARENILSELNREQREKLDEWFQIGSDSDSDKKK